MTPKQLSKILLKKGYSFAGQSCQDNTFLPDGNVEPDFSEKQQNIYIGIDPGERTGVAVRNDKGQWGLLKTMTFWETIYCIQDLSLKYTIKRIVIEDPGQNKSVFPRKNMNVPKWLKVAQNVGMNKNDAKRMLEFCEMQGLPICRAKPTSRSLTKLDASTFATLTGITQRTSEHVRDAVMLIY